MLRPSAPATVPSVARTVAERHDRFSVDLGLYQSLITGFPVVITFAAHAREIDAVEAGGTAAAFSVPSGPVRTTSVMSG